MRKRQARHGGEIDCLGWSPLPQQTRWGHTVLPLPHPLVQTTVTSRSASLILWGSGGSPRCRSTGTHYICSLWCLCLRGSGRAGKRREGGQGTLLLFTLGAHCRGRFPVPCDTASPHQRDSWCSFCSLWAAGLTSPGKKEHRRERHVTFSLSWKDISAPFEIW